MPETPPVSDIPKPKKGPIAETVETLLVALLMALFIRAFFFSVFYIPSGSMIPTLLLKDRLIVNKMIFGLPNPLQESSFNQKFLFFFPNPLYKSQAWLCRPKYLIKFSRKPKRMEVLVFKAPLEIVGGPTNKYLDKKRGLLTTTYFFPPSKPGSDYIKRLIGLPGDVVELRKGIIYINKTKLEEKHLYYPDQANFGPVQVPTACYFMMGDNRAQSSDSRVWGFVQEDNIVGKAAFKIWPLFRIGFIR
jgi:signal peptidase I